MADVLRTLYTLDLMSNGGLGTVILAHHIGVYNQLLPAQSHDSSSINCGMINETEDSLRAQMKKRMPERAEEIEGMRFGAFTKRVFLLTCWWLDCLVLDG